MNQAALPKNIHANPLMIKDMRANTQYAIVPYYLKPVSYTHLDVYKRQTFTGFPLGHSSVCNA